ncbi:anthranilate/aminodeoxychorismate synthase component II [Candidatus Peregrinibacteria bacterium]|nr:anthranilate/aminodeoxychorismate synthase component II [Candidatus Peregrinibacteria bacterium]
MSHHFLLIDNYDSFTFNLYQQLSVESNATIDVIRNDDVFFTKLDRVKKYDKIIVSPGPKRPVDAGISLAVIKKYYTQTPILGVCLGMQCINEVFGGTTIASPLPVHGKTSMIVHDEEGLFNGINKPFTVARYHSLIIDNVPKELRIIAQTKEGIPMAVEHTRFPVFGVQFHPESFMSDYGSILIRNFLTVS